MKTNKKKMVLKKAKVEEKKPELTHETFVERVLRHVVEVVFPKTVTLDTTEEKTKKLVFTPEEVVVGDEEEHAIRWNADKGGYNFIIYCRHSLNVKKHVQIAMDFISKDRKPKRIVTMQKLEA